MSVWSFSHASLYSSAGANDNALWRVAGLPPRGIELTRMLEAGLPVAVIDDIRHWSAMTRAEIMKVTGINERNIARRKSTGKVCHPTRVNVSPASSA